MLKTRIIPTLLYKNHGLVKGVGFDSWRRVGTTLPAVKVYHAREVDELVILDISATPGNTLVDCEEVDAVADECFMPLTVGGGVRSADEFNMILRAGADKVALNTGALENPSLISEASRRFGSQCVVLSIDYRCDGGRYEVYSHCGTRATGRDPVQWAIEAVEQGAGEILLTSIERDGTMTGYDVEMNRKVAGAVPIPVIAAGGAGNFEHMREVIEDAGVSAVAAASMFHFTEQTPLGAKHYLAEKDIPVRL